VVGYYGAVKWFTWGKKGGGAERPKKVEAFAAIRQLGGGGAVLFEGPLNELRFSEALIIAKSRHFFNDPEPCFIHRSAVAARLFGELNLLLENKAKVTLADVRESCAGYFDEYPGAETIRVITGIKKG
jgi:hypothetical protein